MGETTDKNNKYCNIPIWHRHGITGKGIAVWNCEGDSGHGHKSRGRILDSAPDATVFSGNVSYSSKNGALVNPIVHLESGDGSPVMVNKTEAAKEWINLVVRTRQGRYPIYAVDFGGDAMDIIGKKLPKGFNLSEFKRKMIESIKYNPGIDDAEGFTYDGEYIRFTCLLADGTKEVTEVEYRY